MNMGGGVRVWVYFQGKLTGFADQLGMGSERNRGVITSLKAYFPHSATVTEIPAPYTNRPYNHWFAQHLSFSWLCASLTQYCSPYSFSPIFETNTQLHLQKHIVNNFKRLKIHPGLVLLELWLAKSIGINEDP